MEIRDSIIIRVFQKLDEEFWRAKRYNEAFTLLLLQIANFDEIQLAYGNVGASRILIAVAKILTCKCAVQMSKDF